MGQLGILDIRVKKTANKGRLSGAPFLFELVPLKGVAIQTLYYLLCCGDGRGTSPRGFRYKVT